MKSFILKILNYLIPALTYFAFFQESAFAFNFLVFYGWIYTISALIVTIILGVFYSNLEPAEMLKESLAKNNLKILDNAIKISKRKSPFHNFNFVVSTALLIISIIFIVGFGHIGLGFLYFTGLCFNMIAAYIGLEIYKMAAKEYEEYKAKSVTNDCL